MNAIITQLKGASHKGWIIGLFTISAGLSRPFSGKLADNIGRKKVLLFGVVVSFIASISYMFSFSVLTLLIIRFIHGFATGFFPTGATALITDILPKAKRGTGMGIWGTFISLGIGVGQGLSTFIVQQVGLNGLFVFSALMVVVAQLFVLQSKETLKQPQSFSFKLLRVKRDEIIEPSVIPVAVVMFLSAICSGIIFVLTPDISTYLHIENKGSFFVFYVIATIIIRLTAGKLSDRIGRRQVLLIGMSLLAFSMYLIGTAQSASTYTIASIIFGIATGISSPTIFAWTADLSPEARRGIGAGTMFIALEFGIFSGALITNYLYDNTFATIYTVFSVGIGAALITIVYLIWHLLKHPHHQRKFDASTTP
jgi:MFS family permease